MNVNLMILIFLVDAETIVNKRRNIKQLIISPTTDVNFHPARTFMHRFWGRD